MSNYVYLDLEKEFLKHEEYKSTEGTLLKSVIISKIKSLDEKTMSIILSFPELKNRFTKKLNDTILLDQQSLLSFFQSREFINNSFTEYTNKIGLTNGLKFLDHSDEVVLDFPYKDCVLLGNQSKEENEGVRQKFFHEVINFQEIDRLFTKKVLCNFQKHTKNGIVPISDFKETDNLVIKGNNLIALHTIKEKFAGKVKLIYIDPPYNTESLKFAYNDKFDQATWLTFMKNRLDVAKDFLRDDGAIFIHIDYKQLFNLKVLCDSIFKKENFIQLISVKTSSPAGFKTVNPGPIDVTEYILFYTKNKKSFNFKKQYVKTKYDPNYKYFIENFEQDSAKWVLKSINDCIYEENGIIDDKEAKLKWGTHWKVIKEQLIADFALKNKDKVASIRDPQKPSEKVNQLMILTKTDRNKVYSYQREDGSFGYIINGGALAFYGNKVRSIDGKETPTELLTDFWSDLSWDGIAGEGGVKLKNGKKPEALLRRIIELGSEPNDIILDYHLGSGTTCAAAHKMRRQYIGIEQLDYDDNDSIERLKNVINNDLSGISKFVNWQSGGEFVSIKLFSLVEDILNQITQAKSQEDVNKIIDLLLSEKYFYYLGINENKVPYEEIFSSSDFKQLSIEEQKTILHASIDKNNLYVDLNDLHDNIINLSKHEKELNEKFYKDNK